MNKNHPIFSNIGIAVDWIGRNLYWLDMRADKIEVAKLDGSQRSVLINTDIDSPRAMQVDPGAGYLARVLLFINKYYGSSTFYTGSIV